MRGRRWDAVPLPRALVGSLRVALAALLALPGAGALALDDPEGDAETKDGLDLRQVVWRIGETTVTVEAHFVPGELPDNRSLRGVLVLGTPGEAEPAEWYQFTIGNETHAFVGHAGPKDAAIVSTSWTGDIAHVELQRDTPAAAAPCSFAVIEAGTMGPHGFVVSDAAPPGFASPDAAWPVDQCPQAHAEAEEPDVEDADKDSPALPFVLIALALLVLAIRRR